MDTQVFKYRKVVVIGVTSSGKSTLAHRLAEKIKADFIDLDSLHWESNWVEAPDTIFQERVDNALKTDTWVVAGNYHVVRDSIWPNAEVLIWLDYPIRIVFWRLLTRTIRRSITKEKLFAGNVETLWPHLQLWSENSLFHWLFKTYWRRKKEYPKLFASPENTHLTVLQFHHPRETEEWLNKISRD